MMSFSSRERNDYHNLSHHNRQEIQQLTSLRTQRKPLRRQKLDRYTMPVNHQPSNDYGKLLNFFSDIFNELNIKKQMTKNR